MDKFHGAKNLFDSQSGSMSGESEAPLISKDTSNSTTQSGSSALQVLLDQARILSAEEARKWKPSPTVKKPTRDSMDHGSSASQAQDKVTDLTSSPSDDALSKEHPFGTSRKNRQAASRGTGKGLSHYKNSRTSQHGGKSAASTYSGRRAQVNRALFTNSSDTQKFTLWQAKSMAGSMGISASVFSSLTSMRALLNQKRSMSSWMVIHSDLHSKAGSTALGILLELLSPTNPTARVGRIPRSADSSQEGSSDSTEDTLTDSPTIVEIDSDGSSSEPDLHRPTYGSNRGAHFYDAMAQEASSDSESDGDGPYGDEWYDRSD